MGCEDCHDTGVVEFEDHDMPCPYCRPDEAREASARYLARTLCEMCGGPLVELGSLGRPPLRCRNCGMDHIVQPDVTEHDAVELRVRWECAHRGPTKTP